MNPGDIFVKLAHSGEPPLIAQLSRAAFLAGVAQAAVRLEIFTKLHGERLNAAAIADLLGSDHRYTKELLNACAAIGLLEKIGDEYQNTEESDTYLVKGETKYYGDCLTYMTGLWHLMDDLDSAVQTGQAASHEEEFKSEAEEAEYWHHYMMAMHQWGTAGQQHLLLQNTDLTGKKKLLDVGGGSGAYSIALCQKYPELTATLFDQEQALPLAGSLIEAQGLSEVISTVAGDYYTDSFGAGYDVVLFSGVLCQESGESQRRLMRKAYESMESGGLIIVQDILKIGPYTETSPLTAIASIIIAMSYGGQGGVISGDATAEFLTSVGFTSPNQIPLPGVYSLVTALRP